MKLFRVVRDFPSGVDERPLFMEKNIKTKTKSGVK
jgi:hypothetical protein